MILTLKLLPFHKYGYTFHLMDIFIIVLYCKFNKQNIKKLFISDYVNTNFSIVFVSLLALIVAYLLVTTASYPFTEASKIDYPNGNKISYTFSFLLESLFLAPIFEELFFRRILAHQFSKRYGFNNAILLSALLFALAHVFSGQSIYQPLLLGVLFAYFYLKTKNIYLVILIHSLSNLFIYSTVQPLTKFYNYIYYSTANFWLYYTFTLLTLIVIGYFSIRFINNYYGNKHIPQ